MPSKDKERNFDTKYKWWNDMEKIVKIEQAFSIGCTDKEACAYAEITQDQLYYYENTINTRFRAKKREMKQKPVLKARQTVVKNLDQPQYAQWYLERKRKKEFSTRQELTGKNGEDFFKPSVEEQVKINKALDDVISPPHTK